MHLKGAANDVPIEASTAGHRNTEFVMTIKAAWGDPTEFDQHVEWAGDFIRDVQPNPRANGYNNFQTVDEGEDRTRQTYTEGILSV